MLQNTKTSSELNDSTQKLKQENRDNIKLYWSKVGVDFYKTFNKIRVINEEKPTYSK